MRTNDIRLLRGALIDKQTALFLLADMMSLTLSFVLAYYVSPSLKEILPGHEASPLASFGEYDWLLLVIYPAFIFVLFYRGMYEGHGSMEFSRVFLSILHASLVTLILLTFFIFLFKVQYISRFMIFVFSTMTVVLTTSFRIILFYSWPLIRKLEGRAERILVVGSRRRAKDFLDSIEESAHAEIIGCIDPDPDSVGKRVGKMCVIATIEDPRKVIAKEHPDLIVIAMPVDKIDGIEKLFDAIEEIGIPVMIMPDYHIAKYQQKLTLSTISIENYHGIPMLMLATTTHPKPALFLKRAIDLSLSLFLLIAASPLFIIIALLVKLSSPGPVFYRWNVTGKNGREFTGYKFRTMVQDADRLKERYMRENEMSGPVFKIKNDPRITPVGKWLRKFSLDELPQLYSVLRGDMSLVGPRPPLRTEAERFEFWQRRKLSVKPGITCLWQVNGRNDITDFSEWVRLDLEYIDRWSLGLDLTILLKTIPAVFRGTGR